MRQLWVLVDDVKEKLSPAEVDVALSYRLSGDAVRKLVGDGIKVASPARDSDIRLIQEGEPFGSILGDPKPTAVIVQIRSGHDEGRVMDAFAHGAEYVILRCPNWKIIPLENMISKKGNGNKLLMEVTDHLQARTAMETLELGSDGVLLTTSLLDEVKRTREELQDVFSNVSLVEAKVTAKRDVGLGARACVDTTDLLKPGEGILVGCQSNGLFLVEAEVGDNPYISSRPFRVNAGPVSLYVLSSRDKTNYLSELEAGHPVLIVNRDGNARAGCVGRIKIEKRPMMLLEAEWQGRRLKIILQNAETIRLMTRNGSTPVTDIKPGSQILAHIEEGGRHFGTLVAEEAIIER